MADDGMLVRATRRAWYFKARCLVGTLLIWAIGGLCLYRPDACVSTTTPTFLCNGTSPFQGDRDPTTVFDRWLDENTAKQGTAQFPAEPTRPKPAETTTTQTVTTTVTDTDPPEFRRPAEHSIPPAITANGLEEIKQGVNEDKSDWGKKSHEVVTAIESVTTSGEGPKVSVASLGVRYMSGASSGRVFWLVSYFAMFVCMLSMIIYCISILEDLDDNAMWRKRLAQWAQALCVFVPIICSVPALLGYPRLGVKSRVIEDYVTKNIEGNIPNLLWMTDALFLGCIVAIVGVGLIMFLTAPRYRARVGSGELAAYTQSLLAQKVAEVRHTAESKAISDGQSRDEIKKASDIAAEGFLAQYTSADARNEVEQGLKERDDETTARLLMRMPFTKQWIQTLAILSAIVLATIVLHLRSFMLLPISPLGGCTKEGAAPGIPEYCTSIDEIQSSYGVLATIVLGVVLVPITLFHRHSVTEMLSRTDDPALKEKIAAADITWSDHFARAASIILPLLTGAAAAVLSKAVE